MRRPSTWWVIATGAVCLSVATLASAAGWLGPLVACGADGAAVCVTWPAAAALGTWLVFAASIVGMLAWHVREWRRDPRPR